MKAALFIAVLVALIAFARAQGGPPPCQKYKIQMFGGQHGLEQYPYNRELSNVKDLQGVRAMITLFDEEGMEEGIIYFVNDEYLRSVPVNEYPALPGKVQISAQPYSQFNNVLSTVASCVARVTVEFKPECTESQKGVTVVNFAN
ncbi:uncharacterized protein ACA1_200150 [Acanthamoeba castellanii str. Neff]|uniref:Uncharacterized protein n=1 Tax=Acanthamoeba castellanii (strain ATCC 30010 / Neff) TaxID=1257118 RepID=L8H4R2_ACACF|nr:uncharacterized protein ACA1_200150 [Acanthamoeba castellanii str. Neff]ELR19718.1 hypothetical protein ACA1_200150 [Acanthamoeba castellanii str. Neff]